METTNRISEVAKLIVDNYDGFDKYYTPTFRKEEISEHITICGVLIQASRTFEYVDILGLTKDEQNELEVKITELKSRKKNETTRKTEF